VKYVSLKYYNRLTIEIITGAWAGGTAAVTLNEAKTVAGGSATGLSFSYQWNDTAASGTLVKTAVTADTFDLDTAESLYVIEVRADMLTVNSGFDCVGVAIASPGANNDYYAVKYTLWQGRYMQATPASPLAD